MSLDQKLQLWNAIGTWVAGLATFAAVLVSLHLARQPSKVKLKVTAGLRYLVGGGREPVEVFDVSVTNLGERPVVISTIAWAVGKGKQKRYALQIFNSSVSANIPHTLGHGEKASFMFTLSEAEGWLEDMANNFIGSDAPGVLSTLSMQVHTSVGQHASVKPEPSLLARFAEAYKAA